DLVCDRAAVGEKGVRIARLGEPELPGDAPVALRPLHALRPSSGLGVDLATERGDAVAAVLQDRLLEGVALVVLAASHVPEGRDALAEFGDVHGKGGDALVEQRDLVAGEERA